MYEPPIDIQLINRGELERALAFDRGQYDKGFADGVNSGIQKLLNAVNPDGEDDWLCDSCKYHATNAMNYPCSQCRYVTCLEMSQYKWEPKEE